MKKARGLSEVQPVLPLGPAFNLTISCWALPELQFPMRHRHIHSLAMHLPIQNMSFLAGLCHRQWSHAIGFPEYWSSAGLSLEETNVTLDL